MSAHALGTLLHSLVLLCYYAIVTGRPTVLYIGTSSPHALSDVCYLLLPLAFAGCSLGGVVWVCPAQCTARWQTWVVFQLAVAVHRCSVWDSCGKTATAVGDVPLLFQPGFPAADLVLHLTRDDKRPWVKSSF